MKYIEDFYVSQISNNPSFYFCCHKPAQCMQFNPLHNIDDFTHSNIIYINLDNHSVVLSGEPTALPKLVSSLH